MEREKITKSGKLLDIDFFPVLASGRKMPIRPKGTKPSSEAQTKYNYARAVKNSVRLINANFNEGDLWVTVTFDPKYSPKNFEEADRMFANYIRRIKTKRTSELKRVTAMLKSDPENKRLREVFKKLSGPFRYYVRIEETVYKSGAKKGQTDYHYHLFITGGLDRDVVESLWKNGARIDADRFRPQIFGPEAAARYTCKGNGRKIFRHSKNLKKPVFKSKDGGITARGVEKLCKERIEDREYWERRYKGYRFIRCFARFNKYNKHWYLSVVMYRSDSDTLPDFSVPQDEWITEGVV